MKGHEDGGLECLWNGRKLFRTEARRFPPRFLRKEVIQPQVPLRLPCYDFTPVTSHTIGGCLPFGLTHRLPVQLASMV